MISLGASIAEEYRPGPMAPSLLAIICATTLLGSPASRGSAASGKAPAKPVAFKAQGGCQVRETGSVRTIECQKEVKLWREDLSLECEKLTATLDAQGTLRDATCQGAVKVISTKVTALAQQAHLDERERTLQLQGRPKVFQAGQQLSGQSITMDVDTGDVRVDGAVEGVFVPKGSAPAASGARP